MIEQLELRKFVEQSYLDYSMYVILDRALPHISDGLKPVQRRIVYAMSELGLNNEAKYKKSARTVGDVLGKYHPHGDSACYEAMVLMAQDFAYRYPLIDGQGNWGSSDDPKSFAAMRYTEAKLAPYAKVLLQELDQGTVEWLPNFDGTLKEPKLLPARLPNILLNGTSGIAVGMSTDIPPHNLKEVVNACLYLLDRPNASVEELCEFIQGPDFASAAEIVSPKKDLIAIYKTGNGTLRVRAKYEEQNGEIVVTALPPQISGANVLAQIADLMNQKKLSLISDLRDESDIENPTRLVIVPRSNRVDLQQLMDHLFATTDLEKVVRVNFNMITLDGKPRVMPLNKLLNEWLLSRTNTLRSRLEHRLGQVRDRMHILDGFLLVYANLDQVIAIIREEEEPKTALMAQYKISEIQAQAILELRLRQLAKLEEFKLKDEKQKLLNEENELSKHLESDKSLKNLLKLELKQDTKLYGDERRNLLVERAEAQKLSLIEKIPADPITVVVSAKGWIRSAKGHDIDVENLSYKAGDSFLQAVYGKQDQVLILLDAQGRSYSLAPHSLPSARGQGEPLSARLELSPQYPIIGMILGDLQLRVLLLSNQGYGFIITVEDLQAKNKAGKAVINLGEGASLLPPVLIKPDDQLLCLATDDGRILILDINSLQQMQKGKGQKLIHLKQKNKQNLISHAVFSNNQSESKIFVISGNKTQTLKYSEYKNYFAAPSASGVQFNNVKKIDLLKI